MGAEAVEEVIIANSHWMMKMVDTTVKVVMKATRMILSNDKFVPKGWGSMLNKKTWDVGVEVSFIHGPRVYETAKNTKQKIIHKTRKSTSVSRFLILSFE